MVEFSKRDDVQRWLQDKPREIAVVIAARAALRAIPALALALGPRGGGAREAGRDVVLGVLRVTAASWVAAKTQMHGVDIQGAASAAARAVDFAFAVRASTSRIAVAASVDAAYAAGASAAVDAYRSAASGAVDSSASAASGASDAPSSAVAHAYTYEHASADASAIDAGMMPDELAGRPLWPDGVPEWAGVNWQRLRPAVLALGEDWQVWTEWYAARLEGRVSNEVLEVARVMIKDEIWEQGPKLVNAEIKGLIQKHTAKTAPAKPSLQRILDNLMQAFREPLAPPIDTVPLQGPGPRFRATEEGPLDRTPPADFDAEGNDTKTIDRLRPLALRCAADLKTRLPPNQFGELLSAVDLYIAALDPGEGKTIEWGVVWGHGVILQNAASSAERKVDERILPALEDPAKTALESLLTLHGPMILATRDGAKFSETAAGFRLTRAQQEALRVAAQRVAEQLKADKEVITPRAAASVAQATESIGQGPHPERGSVYGLATVKNISIVLIGGAAVATPALVGALLGSALVGAAAGAPFSWLVVEAVKKSPAFNALATQLGARIESMTDIELRAWMEERRRRYAPFRAFVIRNEEPLRKIAEATPELKWMLRYIDFIAEKPDQT